MDKGKFVGLCCECQTTLYESEMVILGDKPYHRKCVGKEEEDIEDG